MNRHSKPMMADQGARLPGRFHWGLAAFIAVPACGLVANLGAYDGYTQVADDASLGPRDSGADPAAALDATGGLPLSDAFGDGANREDAGRLDSGLCLATNSGTVEPCSWCATLSPTPDYCRDFDTWKVLEHWSPVPLVIYESAYAKNGMFKSAPACLDIVGKNVDTAQLYGQAQLTYSVPRIPKRIRFAYDFRMVTPPNSISLFQTIQLGTYPSDWSLKMQISGDGTVEATSALILEYTQKKGPTALHPLGTPPGMTGWTRVAFDVQLNLADGGASSLSVSYDGVPQLANDVVQPPGFETIPDDAGDRPKTTIDVGVDYVTAPSTGFEFYVDNAVIYFD